MAEFFESIATFIMDYIVFPLINISLVDVIDILLLSILLYMVYKFIRQRNAGRLAIGLVALLIIYVISDWLNMLAINSIFKSFYTVGIMAVCVIFQPELRAVLEEVGSTSLSFRDMSKKYSKEDQKTLAMINEVCAAVFTLSQNGEGALIVLERNSRLHSQMSEGVRMDARVSRELLCNIFVNKSPLHDGAVIIRDLRIVSASSKSKTISDNDDVVFGLGTRHRAGVRISEVSDAVVVIVSEETGIISVANNKLLKRHYNKVGNGGIHNYSDLSEDLFKLMAGKNIEDMVSTHTEDGRLLSAEEIISSENEMLSKTKDSSAEQSDGSDADK